MSRTPVVFAVLRRRRQAGPIELAPPPARPTSPPAVRRPTVTRWPEPGAIEQLFREAKRLRP